MAGQGMASGRYSRGRQPSILPLVAALLAGAMIVPPPPALAQAAARAPITFAIPAGPLPDVLAAFGRQSGLQISYLPEVARGVRSPGVSGQLPAGRALANLLAGTGLSYRFANANTVTVERPGAATAASTSISGAIPLDMIDVTGNGDGTTSYVATRSAAGTKTDTPLIETPQSVSVVTRKQIDDQAIQSVRQALRYTPGVISDYRGAGGSRYDTIIYRGFGGGVNYDYAFLDGLRLAGTNYAVPQIDPYLLDRIEVVRGPASVLFGQNTPGGLVNLVSKMPTAQPFHEVVMQAGTFNRFQGGFDLGGPIDAEGKYLYRLTGVGHFGNTQVDYQKDDRIAIAPAFTWRPDADTSLTILAKYQHDPNGGYFGFLPAVGTVLPLPNGSRIPRNFFDGSPLFDQFDRTEAAIGYKLEHRFNEVWSMNSSFRYMHLDLDYKSVYTTGIDTSNPNDPRLTRSAIFNTAHSDAIGADNNVQAEFATGPLQHRALLGIDYQRLAIHDLQGTRAQSSLSIFNPDYTSPIAVPAATMDAQQTLTQLGLYAQDQIKWGGLTVLTGVRHDWADNDRNDRLAPPAIQQNDRAFTWRAGAIYNFENGIAPYASYSTSFQPSSGADYAGNLFKPTTGQQFEAGIKYQPPGTRVLLTAAYYDLTQQNVLTTDPAHTMYSIQTGEVRSRGFELEGRATLEQGLELIASYSYMDNINTQSTTAQGKHPTYVPDQTAGLWADYTIQTGTFTGLGFGGGVRYIGRSYVDAANTMTVPDYTLVDAAIHYDFGRADPRLKGWRAALNASNLFDKGYVSACATATKCFYGAGRTITATLAYRW